jgi:hypothetical protein
MKKSTGVTAQNRVLIARLVESGGPLAESVLWALRHLPPTEKERTDQLKKFVVEWDAAVLSVPAEWLEVS